MLTQLVRCAHKSRPTSSSRGKLEHTHTQHTQTLSNFFAGLPNVCRRCLFHSDFSVVDDVDVVVVHSALAPCASGGLN